MSDYDFRTLSPLDFENLVRDLLQCELSIHLESFKTGKDSGIDFRYSKGGSQPLIVQAKHFANTGFRGLLSHLKLNEKPKIEKLQPERYLLATSVALSPSQKDEISEVLFPFIKEPSDIYGREDLNNLLGLFRDIEKQHFKLWLSSITVMEEVLHSRILNQTRITLQGIKDKARIYVVNDSFTKALAVLKDYNYVIIAGIPGIGKTTLAKMLVLHYLRSDYEFVDVSYDINEAYTIPEHHLPRVYLYDDFLGRTSLAEKLKKNEDLRLVNFISSIRRRKSAKLILTTREYILRQAQKTYEALNSPVFDKPQCIVDLSQYTRPIRAQILYNHLYFSTLPREHIEAIVHQGTYLKIIDHPNYNPRILEYMTDPMWIPPQRSTEYPAIFLQNLQEPFLIWKEAFDNHLSGIAREIVLVLGTLPGEVFLEDLLFATRRVLSHQGIQVQERELNQALSELQGNFIILRQDRENEIVSFHNPSVQDFANKYLEKNLDCLLILANTAFFFEQVEWICNRANSAAFVSQIQDILLIRLKESLLNNPCALIKYGTGPFSYKGRKPLWIEDRLAFIASLLGDHDFSFCNELFRDSLFDFTNQIHRLRPLSEGLFNLVKNVVHYVLPFDRSSDLECDFLDAAKEALFDNAYYSWDVSYICEFRRLVPQISAPDDEKRIIEVIDHIIDNNLNYDDAESLSDELSSLEEIEKKYGLVISEQIESLRNLVWSAEENSPPEEEREGRYRGYSTGTFISDDALSDMFSTLLR